MTEHLDAHLRLRLKGLRRDIAPGADLWPSIATQLQLPATGATAAHDASRHQVPVATADVLLLAIGFPFKLGVHDRSTLDPGQGRGHFRAL